MVGVLPPDGPARPTSSWTRTAPSDSSNRSRSWPSPRGAAGPGATATRTRRSTSRATSMTPTASVTTLTATRATSRSARSSRTMRSARPWTSSCARGWAHPRAVVPLDIYRTGEHRARLAELGEWVVAHGIDGPGPWRAARDLLLERPPRVGQAAGAALARPDEPEVDGARRLALVDRRVGPRDPGPAGLGQDLHGRADDLRPPRSRQDRRHHGHQPQGHRQPAPRGAVGREPAGVAGGRPGRSSGRTMWTPGSTIRAWRSWRQATSPRASMAEPISSAARPGCGRTHGCSKAVDVLFVDEAGQISLANVVAMSGLGIQHRAARRSAAARPAPSGHASTGRRPIRAGPCARRRRDHAAGPGPLPRDDMAPPPGPVRVHVRGLLRRPARARGPSRCPGGPRLGRVRGRRCRPAAARPADGGRRQREPGGGGRGGVTRPGPGRERHDLDRRGRPHPPAHHRRMSSSSLRTTPRWRPSAGSCRRMPGSAPWTSSRARKRPSASTRSRRRHRSSRRAAWTSCTAAIGSMSRRHAPGAWPSSSRPRICCASGLGPRNRCASPTPSVASWNSPRRPARRRIGPRPSQRSRGSRSAWFDPGPSGS